MKGRKPTATIKHNFWNRFVLAMLLLVCLMLPGKMIFSSFLCGNHLNSSWSYCTIIMICDSKSFLLIRTKIKIKLSIVKHQRQSNSSYKCIWAQATHGHSWMTILYYRDGGVITAGFFTQHKEQSQRKTDTLFWPFKLMETTKLDPSSTPRTHVQRVGMVAHCDNPRAGEL